MKLVTYLHPKFATTPPQGIFIDNEVVDSRSLGYPTVLSLIEAAHAALEVTTKLAKRPAYPTRDVTLHAPIPRPPRIFGIGLNYQKHADESKMAVQKVPTVFMKLPSSVVGPDHPIILPKISTQPDYEAEFAVVIGKPGYQIAAEDWQHHVFGYTIVNDVSARDIQLATSQWTLGKSFPTFTPMGPSITTADEVPDPTRSRHLPHHRRRNPPGLQHQRPHLQDSRAHRLHLQHHAPRSRRHHQHRNP